MGLLHFGDRDSGGLGRNNKSGGGGGGTLLFAKDRYGLEKQRETK